MDIDVRKLAAARRVLGVAQVYRRGTGQGSLLRVSEPRK